MEVRSQRSESGRGVCLELRVPAVPSVVSEVRQALAEFPMPAALADDARLLVSELVTNSIRHAGLHPDDRIRVRAEWTGTRLRVDVIDRARVAESPVVGAIRPAPGAESGWGLYLLERLATRWGNGRGRYWFELDCEAGRRSS